MAQPSVSQFLDVVERSGLIDRAQIQQALDSLQREVGPAAPHDTQVVSSHLTGRGLLTGWQNERLLEGRHRGFFLGKYKLLDHLGTGGMSSVYLAEHRVMRRRVAIKVLPTHQAQDPSRVRRFHREARAVASLDHPNVVRAFDVDQDGDVHFLVMEYVPGRDLKTIVEQDGPLSPRLAADYIRQAAEGLAVAHRLGLVHRDMKPANLIVDLRGAVKVLDLGLASVTNDIDAGISKEFDDKVLGTVDYLAPEQALNSQLVDGRADIYSLGCTLYFALVGHPPFPDGTLGQRIMAHQMREPADIRQQRPQVPQNLVDICRRMMAKSPSRRYQTMDEVATALADSLRAPARTSQPAQTNGEELGLAPLDDKPVFKETRTPPDNLSARTNGSRTPSHSKFRNVAAPHGTRRLRKARQLAAPAQPGSTSRSPLDDLLSDAGIFTDSGGASLPARTRTRPLEGLPFARRQARQNRWESPWFLIVVGTLLAMLLIAAYFFLRSFVA